MNKIEELRKQLDELEVKEDELRQQRKDNEKAINQIKDMIASEERKIAGDTILPLMGKYVKWVCNQPKAHGYNISKYIHIDKITEKQEYDNEYIITGQAVVLYFNESDKFTSYLYDGDFEGRILLDWNDPLNNYFKVEDFTEVSEEAFNIAKDTIKTIL